MKHNSDSASTTTIDAAAFERNKFKTQILAEQVKLLYRFGRRTRYGSLILAILVSIVLWDVRPHWAVIGFLALSTIVMGLRIALSSAYERSAPVGEQALRWGKWSAGLTLLNGCTWGAAAVLLFVPGSITYQVFLVLSVVGICAGSVTGNAPYMPAFYGFFLPPTLAMVGRLLAEGDLIHLASGGMGVVFVGLFLSYARAFNSTLVESIVLRFENTDLIDRLSMARES